MKRFLGAIACFFSGHLDPAEFHTLSVCPRCGARLFTNYFAALQAEAVHQLGVETEAERARLAAGWARERDRQRGSA